MGGGLACVTGGECVTIKENDLGGDFLAKSANQKLKLLYLAKIFLERTDEEHPLTTAQLIEALADYGVSAERKSLYSVRRIWFEAVPSMRFSRLFRLRLSISSW